MSFHEARAKNLVMVSATRTGLKSFNRQQKLRRKMEPHLQDCSVLRYRVCSCRSFQLSREDYGLFSDQRREVSPSTIEEVTESPHLCQYQLVHELVLKRCSSTVGPEELGTSAPNKIGERVSVNAYLPVSGCNLRVLPFAQCQPVLGRNDSQVRPWKCQFQALSEDCSLRTVEIHNAKDTAGSLGRFV